MNKTPPLPALIAEIAEAQRIYDRLAFDDEMEHELGKPCSPRQIARLEKMLGRPLPPSYRAFLELHDGWSDFSGDSKLLAVADQRSDWVLERLDDIDELFDEFGPENPFKHGAIPVLLGEDTEDVLLLDPRTVRPDGEMDFIALEIIEEVARYRDFTAYLAYRLDLLQRMIERQRRGVPDEDAAD